MKKYLHGFVKTICKIRGLVLYTANCKAKREKENAEEDSQKIYCVSSTHCDTLKNKVKDSYYLLHKMHS